MPSLSAIVDRSLRREVSPLLRKAGFQSVAARHAWSWRDDCILVFDVRAVGTHFSQVTRWPPGSVGVSLGVYYPFAEPVPASDIKTDRRGRLSPAEYQCHIRADLHRVALEPVRPSALPRYARRATDLWWVKPDGSNADEVADDIALALSRKGLRWFDKFSDLGRAYLSVKRERNYLTKYALAFFLAQRLGDKVAAERFHARAAAEARDLAEDGDVSTWVVGGLEPVHLMPPSSAHKRRT